MPRKQQENSGEQPYRVFLEGRRWDRFVTSKRAGELLKLLYKNATSGLPHGAHS